MNHEEIIRDYNEKATQWEIDLHTHLAQASTRDERLQAFSQFIADHSDQYKELCDARTEVTLMNHELEERGTNALETRAEAAMTAAGIAPAEVVDGGSEERLLEK